MRLTLACLLLVISRLTAATPRDLLAVQLDDRALFLGEWREILLAALTPDALAGSVNAARAGGV